jgi:hypothetical protein
MPKLLLQLFLLLLLFFPAAGFPNQRTLEISGLKMYSQEELTGLLNLDRYENGLMPAKEVIDAIVAFYSNTGFTLMKVYVIENFEKTLNIYVDEGSLEKIIFLNIDDFTSIYLRIVFRIKHKIFNIFTVNENIEKLRKSPRFKDIKYQIKPVKEFDSSLFQLDRELNIPVIGKKQAFIFEKFAPRYDLVIFLSKSMAMENMADNKKGDTKDADEKTEGTDTATKKNGGKADKKQVLYKLDYGLRMHYYKGFIPYLKYYHLGLLSPGDFFMNEASLGVMYGIDRQFTRLPRFTYFNFNSNYFFTPTLKNIFTPSLRFDLYDSKTARPDLGLLRYNYLTINAMLAPGISFLNKINIYTGFGVETAFFYNSQRNSIDKLIMTMKLQQFDPTRISSFNDPAKGIDNFNNALRLYTEIEKRTDVYGYVEAGAAYDFSKKSTHVYELRKNRLKKEIAVSYNFYFLKKTFNRVRFLGYFDYEFKDRSIYSGALIYQFYFKDPPFYQEASVSNPAFKGLNRTSYFSRNCLSQSNEYRISVYRDFLYVGAYFDMTLFKGSGRDVAGTQFAFAGGPTLRILIIDTFELYLQNGWDYLLSTKKSGSYFYFNIYNKW